MAANNTRWIGTTGIVVSLLATFAAAVGGYYDVRSRGEQTESALQQLRVQTKESFQEMREQTDISLKVISDRQERFEQTALTRWSKVDDVLDQLLTRGIRNETKIDTILDVLRTHMSKDKEPSR